MGDLIFFEVDITHPCWCVELTEKNPDSQLKAIRVIKLKEDEIVWLFELKSPTVKKDIEFIRKHELVNRVEILVLKTDSAIIKVSCKYSAMTVNILDKSNVTLLESPITREGVDKEILLAKNYKDLSKLINAWKEKGWGVKLKRKKFIDEKKINEIGFLGTDGFFDLDSAKETLTPKQFEVFSKACDWGYYKTPKKITIEELSSKLDLSPSTVAEHLRKAQDKLMPLFLKILRKI